MVLRRCVVLALVWFGGIVGLQDIPPGYQWAWLGGVMWLVAYVYAQLTRPKERL